MTMIELQVSPAKSIPLAHLVENRTSVSFEVNSSMFVFPLFWSSSSLSFVIMLSSINFLFSSSEGKSLNADT